MYDFRNQFPDFDPAHMPPIPSEWKDISWSNDSCPSFAITDDVVVFVDYADINLREIQSEYPRFSVQTYSADGNAVCNLVTDNWDEVLNYFKI